MQHVIRLSGPRLPTRIQSQTSHAIKYFSSSSQAGQDESGLMKPNTRTLRPRSHGNAALPISALFDPVTVAARQKHEEPKPPPPQDPAELTDFQRELAQNVYAQALATPVRTCVLTKARLPSHFLLPFVTNLPPKQVDCSNPSPSPDDEKRLKPTLAPRIGFPSTRTSRYLVATQSAITHLSGPPMRKKHKGGAKWAQLVTERMKKPWAVRLKRTTEKVIPAKEWEWDEEMGDVVRKLLGREVVKRVRWCAGQEEGLVGDGEKVAVLRIGGEGEEKKELEGSEVYDLRYMLDEEALAEMRTSCGGGEELVLRKHPKTVSAHLALEALRNYVDGNGARKLF